MLAWHAWHSFLVPPTVVPFYRPGVFERVFWGILGAGVFVVLGEGVFLLFSEGVFLLFSGKGVFLWTRLGTPGGGGVFEGCEIWSKMDDSPITRCTFMTRFSI